MRLFSPRVVLYCCIGAAFGCAPSTGGDPGTGGSGATAGTTGSGGTGTGVGGTTGIGGNASGGNASGGSGTGDAGSSGNTGGSGGSGPGAGGTAGSTSTAGTTGTGGRGGGSAGRGGATGSAGSGGATAGSSGGGTTGSGGTGSGNCTFTVTPTMSTKIPTVATITWSTTLAGATSAKIDFGLTTSYGMTAPVATVAASNKTLLLGMKTSKMYNYKITAMAGGMSCESQNYTLMTGALASGLMKPTLSPTTATGLSGGFLITGQYVQGAGAGATAYILDGDGDYVWWYGIGYDVTGARMSYDGNYMWINSANVPSGTAHVRRVTMDGMTENNYDSQFTGLNHQLAVLPDETVAFYAYGANGCDDIKERSPSGTVKTVINSKTALKISDTMCHCNNIQYSKEDDSLVFSNLQSSQIAKVKRSDGSVTWIMNGSTATITGVTWTGGEHGLHLFEPNKILIFNNNNNSASQGSIVFEVMINGNTATKGWSYTASPAVANMVMGDIQRMANGNTIIGYSTRGVLHEVSSSGAKLQTWSFAAGQSFGYIEKRPTLYGPPPR